MHVIISLKWLILADSKIYMHEQRILHMYNN